MRPFRHHPRNHRRAFLVEPVRQPLDRDGLNEGKGEIIKITESLAETFGIELGKNWQSNHSASIHKAKADYQPPIFDKVKEAYLKYAKSLAYEKKLKK